jgi:hypothetical protein
MDQAGDRYTPVMAQWGIPDPRQAIGYPGDGTPSVQWAWELLRRRDDYRAQWRDTIAPYLGADGDFDAAAWDRAMNKVRRRAMETRQPYRIENPLRALGRNFGLHETTGGLDPRRSDRPVFEARLISLESWLGERARQEELRRQEEQSGQKLPQEFRNAIVSPSPWPLGEYECLVTFNVSLPLKPQFEAAEKLLQGFVREVPPDRLIPAGRSRVDKYVRYLRILDFETVAELDAVVGRHLFPTDDPEQRRIQLRDSRAAAKDWQRGYMRLVVAGN